MKEKLKRSVRCKPGEGTESERANTCEKIDEVDDRSCLKGTEIEIVTSVEKGRTYVFERID